MEARSPQPPEDQSSGSGTSRLAIDRLSVIRGEKLLVQDLSLVIQGGEVVHLAGSNGSGKTSLMRCLAGLLPPEQGQITWNDWALNAPASGYFTDLLYLGHSLALKAALTIEENLNFYARLRGRRPNAELRKPLSALQIDAYLQQPVAQLSAGQQRKTMLARLQLEPARIWLLDEPFVALDETSRQWLVAAIERFAAAGGLVIFTSHQRVSGLPVHKTISLSESISLSEAQPESAADDSAHAGDAN